MSERVAAEPTWAEFRAAVRAKIARDLEREAAESRALRDAVVPQVSAAMAKARATGLVGRAWLFGSFAWGEPRPSSDVDLLVEGPEPFDVATLVGRATGRDVHVVPLESAPESLRARVLAEGLPL